jgi:hypothetical protein
MRRTINDKEANHKNIFITQKPFYARSEVFLELLNKVVNP